MSYYVIGIGGTGAKCLEAFTHLCGAGLLKDTQPVKMLFIDADVSCGNLTRTQLTVDAYKKAQELGFGNCGLFANDIDTFKPWTPVPKNCTCLDDVFQRTTLVSRDDTKPLGLLYDALFTKMERETSLDNGFRGHPAIGAAVLSQSMNLNDVDPWKTLQEQISTDKDARVFLFASVFGGTGAAGFPTIAKIVHDTLKKDALGHSVAKFGGALVLPYFQFPPNPQGDEKEMQAKVEDFMLNTRSALAYYDKSGLLGKIFNAIYLVGDNDLTELSTFSLGANTQKNEANFIEIYAALAAFDFFNKDVQALEVGKEVTPMVARADNIAGQQDTIAWEDLPDVCGQGGLKQRLGTFIKFLYVYKHGVYKDLENCSLSQSNKNKVAWYVDLVEKAGKIDVYNNKEAMERFKALNEYAEAFFVWLKDVSENKKRQIKLVNSQVYAPNVLERLFALDVYQVVLPITEGNDKLTSVKFWQALCASIGDLKHTENGGAEILMQAVYDICSK